MCAGGIFDIGTTIGNAQGVPSWIVGDTFLKNVYTVFQANPPAVGFAQLASGLSSSTAGVPLPSGSSSPNSPSGHGSGASPSIVLSTSLALVPLLSLLAGFLVNL